MGLVVHIGNPKCFSTSIQHAAATLDGSQLEYIGMRPGDAVSDWYSAEWISKLLNFDLRFQNNFFFDKQREFYTGKLDERIQAARKRDVHLLISSENLSTRFILDELDPIAKLQRLQGLLPTGVKFLILFRNIRQTLRSIYSEYLNNGYCFSRDHFFDEVYLLREANFLSSTSPTKLSKDVQSALKPNNQLVWHVIDDTKTRWRSRWTFGLSVHAFGMPITTSSKTEHYGFQSSAT